MNTRIQAIVNQCSDNNINFQITNILNDGYGDQSLTLQVKLKYPNLNTNIDTYRDGKAWLALDALSDRVASFELMLEQDLAITKQMEAKLLSKVAYHLQALVA